MLEKGVENRVAKHKAYIQNPSTRTYQPDQIGASIGIY